MDSDRGYKSVECKNEDACLRCSSNHATEECKIDANSFKCINCIAANENIETKI